MKNHSTKSFMLIRKYLEIAIWSGLFSLLILKFFLTTNISSDIDFLNTYKFLSPDSFDWIANGLRLGQTDFLSFRNPGLVMVIKVLFEFGILRFLPLLNALVYGLLIYVNFLIAMELTKSKLISYGAVIILFWNYSFQSFSSYILADFYAISFISLSLYFLLKGRNMCSLFTLGLSATFQNFAFFLMPFWGIYIFYNDLQINSDTLFIGRLLSVLRNRRYVAYIIVGLNLNLIWFLYRFIKFGNPFYSRVEQFSLLNFNIENLPWYLIGIFTLFGFIPGIAFLILDYYRERIIRRPFIIFLICCFAFTFSFWVFFYNWLDRRFLLYLIPFLIPIFIYSLTLLTSRRILIRFIPLMVISVYVMSIPIPSFFTSDQIPISNFMYAKVSKDSILIEERKASRKEIPFPYFAEIINNKDELRNELGNDYYAYSELIRSSYRDGRLKFCGFPVDYYKLNTILLLNQGKSTSEIEVSSDCW